MDSSIHETCENIVWDESYVRGGNICFYPHEEIVRFINRYVRKRKGVNEYENVMQLKSEGDEDFASLDLGCGIGRHVILLDDFGLNPYGIDLSQTAISIGKKWMKSIEKDYLAQKMQVASITNIPFRENFFNICVSHGVLDSMPRKTATEGMGEVYRVLKPDALMYLDLIMDEKGFDGDVVVQSGYEEGTIQSYYTVESIKRMLDDSFKILSMNIITGTDEYGNIKNKRAHVIIQKRG